MARRKAKTGKKMKYKVKKAIANEYFVGCEKTIDIDHLKKSGKIVIICETKEQARKQAKKRINELKEKGAIKGGDRGILRIRGTERYAVATNSDEVSIMKNKRSREYKKRKQEENEDNQMKKRRKEKRQYTHV